MDAPSEAYSGMEIEVSWTVANAGEGRARPPWFDAVYLSLDAQLEPASDILLGHAERTQVVEPGASYSQTARLRVPADLAGLCRVFVVADTTRRLAERGLLTNNLVGATTPIAIWRHPPSDLVVGTVQIPDGVVAGQQMAISYVLRNQGVHPAPGPWVDNVYLSLDDRWDPSDALLGGSSQRGVLLPGDSRTNLLSGPVPGVLPGSYRILVRSDAAGAIHESNETNNLTASLHSVLAGVTELVPDLAAREQIHDGGFLYYRVRTPADRSLVLELSCQEPSAALGLFVRYEGIPSRMEHDFLPFDPPGPRQRVVVPRTRAGDYYILVLGDHLPSPLHADIALTATLPRFQALAGSPDRGGNAGDLTLRIDGVGFDRTCLARLVGDAGPDLVARDHYYETGSRLYATFDLRGVPPGPRSVEVRNREGLATRLPAPLEIVAAGAPPPVVPTITAPTAVGRSRPYSFVVQWSNPSLNDAPAPLLVVGNTVPFGLAPGDESLGTRFTFLGVNTQGGPAGILRPGQTESLRFHAFSGTEEGGYTSYADPVGRNVDAPMDWSRVTALIQTDPTKQEYAEIGRQFVEQAGPTWADYLGMLARNATLMPQEVGQRHLEADLVQLEWARLSASTGPAIAGRIEAEDPRVPVGGLQVVAKPRDHPKSRFGFSLMDGSFILTNLASDIYSVGVRNADGAAVEMAVVDLRSGGTVRDVRVVMHLGCSSEVKVVDEEGEAVAGALVVVGDQDAPEFAYVTDTNGLVTLSGLFPRPTPLAVRSGGFLPLETNINVRVDDANELRLLLKAGGRIAGRVVSSSGQVASDALVLVQARAGPASLNRVVHADEGGFFALAGMRDGEYMVFVGSPYSDVHSNQVEIARGGSVELGTIGLAPTWAARSPEPMALHGDPPRESQGWRAIMLAGLEAVARAELKGIVEPIQGKEYADVVERFLSNIYPTSVRSAEFKDGDETIELLRMGDRSPSSAKGFRRHPSTRWLMESLRSALPRAFLNSFAKRHDLSCSGKGNFDLATVMQGPHRGHIEGRGSDKHVYAGEIPVINPPPDLEHPETIIAGMSPWRFGDTLVGGLGGYGMPNADLIPQEPDTRHIDGTVVAEWMTGNTFALSLKDVTFRIRDAFDFIPGDLGPWVQAIYTSQLKTLERWNEAYDVVLDISWTEPREVYVGMVEVPGIDCANNEDPANRCASQFPPLDCATSTRPTSHDPNDIVGPKGAGAEAWVSATETLAYTIRFENDAVKALAPAQEVRIVQSLSTNLDWRSFRLGGIVFGTNRISIPAGRTHHRERVDRTATDGVWVDVSADLDLARGEARWELRAVDPETGEVPFDPYVGFLPPNRDGVAGQGFVSYTVRPREGVEEGATIPAEARIVFDYNLPLDTPRIVNSVDTGLPSSTVVPLPALVSDEVFELKWQAVDGSGGSGIGGVDVYVSEDDGPWTLWAGDVAAWSVPFTGRCGHAYAFRSVARDRVGHVEPATLTAQARTRVAANRPPILDPIADQVRAVGQRLRWTNVVHDADAGQTVSFSLGAGEPDGMAVDRESGVLTWRPSCQQGGRRYPVTVLATDDGCGRLQATQSFEVTVTDCLAAGLGRLTVAAGQQGCLPLTVESSDGLTYLAFVLELPEDRVELGDVEGVASEVGEASVVRMGPGEYLVTLVAAPGHELRGPGTLANVCLGVRSGGPSAFLGVGIRDLLGFRPDGEPRGNTGGGRGRIAAVGSEPLLEVVRGQAGAPELVLYGQSGVAYEIEARSGVDTDVPWTSWRTVTPTGLTARARLPGEERQQFYRARRP